MLHLDHINRSYRPHFGDKNVSDFREILNFLYHSRLHFIQVTDELIELRVEKKEWRQEN